MSDGAGMKKPVVIELTGEQALVLFEWLKRFNEQNGEEFEDQAEERVLWDIEAMLERVLVEPFEQEYDRLLAEARAVVRDPVE